MQGLLALQRYFDYTGRSGRAEYWQFLGLYLLALVVAYLFDLALSGPYATPTVTLIAYFAGLCPLTAVSVRRLHDRGWTGQWMIASLVLTLTLFLLIAAYTNAQYTALGDAVRLGWKITNIVNFALSIFLLMQFVRRGDEGANSYGAPLSTAPVALDLAGKALALQTSLDPVPSAPKVPTVDPIEQIERLAKPRDAGMLTDEEFQTQKGTYLGRL